MARARLAVVPASVLAVGLSLAGCTGDDGGSEETRPPPDLPTTAPPLWNPCDGLDAAQLERRYGARFEQQTGTESAPRCTFTPRQDGGPAVEVNYQLFPGDLEELFATFGELPEGSDTEVSSPRVPRADGARLVVEPSQQTLTLTGFVRNGNLVQVVNAIDPAPYDRQSLTRAVTLTLTDLATHAAREEVGGE